MNHFIINGRPNMGEGRLLMCQFAIGLLRPNRLSQFRAHAQRYELAHIDRFDEQVRRCKTLFLGGGDTYTLLDALRHNKLWMQSLHNKIIIAQSAGISALTTASYNRDKLRILDGMGILPCTSIVHYNPERDGWMAKELWYYKPELQLMAVQDRDIYVFDY